MNATNLIERGHPPARLLAQMRSVGTAAKLPPQAANAFAEMAADRGLTVTMAEKMAPGLAALVAFCETWKVDTEKLLELMGKFITEATGGAPTDPTALASQIMMDYHVAQSEAMPVRQPVREEYSASGYSVGNALDRGQGMAARMTDGILARVLPGHSPTIGREFGHMSLAEMATVALRSSGQFSPAGGAAAKVEMALHSTSDFPIALGNAVNRVLMASYQAAQSAIKITSKEVSARDFRPMTGVRTSTGMALAKVEEGGEFTYGTIKEAGETFAVDTYGKVFGVTRQAIVNDDLGIFTNIAPILGKGAALTEATLFANLLTKNSGAGPTLSDNVALFHANHGNLGTAAAISVGSVAAARVAMRRQKGLSGEVINAVPYYLLVPPELELVALQFVATTIPTQDSLANPLKGTVEVLTDPNLTSTTRWYMVAKPNETEGLRHAYLEGSSGPQFFQEEGFEVDGMKFKVRLDFGAGFMDHRAWYMNPGV